MSRTVALIGNYWNGDHATDAEHSAAMLMDALVIDGRPIQFTKATVLLGQHHEPIDGDFLQLWLDGVPNEQAAWLLSDPALWLEGSTRDHIGIVPKHLTFVEDQ